MRPAPGARPPAPPRLARALLRLLLDRDAHEIVAGDLEEEFARARTDRRAVRSARRRFWRQTLQSVAARWAPGRSASILLLDSPGGASMTAFTQDIRYGLRQMRHHPGFTAAVACTLAIGIAATTAVFGLINALALRPLPYHEPARVAFLLGWDLARDEMLFNMRFADARDLATVDAFEGVEVYRGWNANLSGEQMPERVQGYHLSGGMFDLLGVRPELGRTFDEADVTRQARVVVLSHGVWQRRFGGDPGIVGRAIALNGVPHTVVGVMPRTFEFPVFNFKGDVWTPLVPDPAWTAGPRDRSPSMVAIARIADSIDVETAQTAASTLMTRLAGQYPDSNRNRGIRVVPMGRLGAEQAAPAFAILAIGGGLVLLLACINVANLLLARSLAREREIAVRTALGAGRRRLVRQLLVEGLLLAVAGGLAGATLAAWALGGIRRSLPEFVTRVLPATEAIRLDGWTAGFAAAISVLTVFGFALLPAWQTSRTPLGRVLQAHRRGTARTRQRLRAALVVGEVAVSVALLVAVGLLGRSAQKLLEADPGFDKDRVLGFSVALPSTRYADRDARIAFYREMTSRLEALPGVSAAGVVNALPFSTSDERAGIRVAGETRDGDAPIVGYRLISPGYPDALGMRVVRGRALDVRDEQPGFRSAVVNQTFAGRLLRDGDPIGRQIHLSDENPAAPPITIVGVVADVQHSSLLDGAAPELYLPWTTDPRSMMSVAVRTPGDPAALVNVVRAEVAAIDPAQAIFDEAPMSRMVANSFIPQQMASAWLVVFGVAAVVLASLGLHGLLAFVVGQRTHEIGVRVALGASRRSVTRLVLGRSIRWLGLGLAAGLVLAAVGAQGLASLLFGVGPFDPASYLLAVGVLGAVALGASYLPARRALDVDPLLALRAE